LSSALAWAPADTRAPTPSGVATAAIVDWLGGITHPVDAATAAAANLDHAVLT